MVQLPSYSRCPQSRPWAMRLPSWPQTQEMICALSDRLLRSEQFLFALRVFCGTARLHRLPFRQELGQYLASRLHRKQRNESLDEEDRAAFISEHEDLAVQLPKCL